MEVYELDLAAASALPDKICFGTSTWTYPGWRGSIYRRDYKNEAQFKRECLSEYASWPLFRTVGIDSAFYKPLSSAQLLHYATQVPANFRWVSKVWERITIPVYPKHARYGKLAGSENPDFLNADLFCESVLAPCQSAEIKPHVGPFIFEFQTLSQTTLAQIDFLARLKGFLRQLPSEFRYAIELRTPSLLSEEYFALLNESKVTHCFNHWNIMPPLKAQMEKAAAAGGLQADFFVARILTPLGVDYAKAVERFKPYDRIKQPNPAMRHDVQRLVKRALQKGIEAFIIINNRAEGNSPQTIDSIIRTLPAST